MNITPDLDISQLARIVVAVFPAQHPRTASWLIQVEPIAFDTGAADLGAPPATGGHPPRPTLLYPQFSAPGSSGDPNLMGPPAGPKPGPRYQPAPQGPTTHATPQWNRQARSPRRPPPPPSGQFRKAASPQQTRPLDPPQFARLWRGSASDWGRGQKGSDIPWDEEQKRVDAIIRDSGITGWQQGFLTDLLCLSVNIDISASRTAVIELFIPRGRAFHALLAGVGEVGQPQRFFEIDRSDLSPVALREIAEVALS